MDAPKTIYLIQTPSGLAWRQNPAPGDDMTPPAAVEYIRTDALELTIAKMIAENDKIAEEKKKDNNFWHGRCSALLAVRNLILKKG